MRAESFEEFVHGTGVRMMRTAVLLCGDRDQAEVAAAAEALDCVNHDDSFDAGTKMDAPPAG